MITVELLTTRVKQIPLLSPAARKLMALLGDPASSLGEIATLVELDPNLTVHVLRAANAAFFHRGTEILGIRQAVSLMGEETVFSVAMRACAGDVMNHPLEGYIADETCLWSHSLCTGLAARQLARLDAGGPDPELAYTAGLLHDIGKAVLSAWLSQEPGELARRCANPVDHEFTAVEEALLGIGHLRAGYVLAKHWKLPDLICEAILNHHQPGQAPAGAAHLTELVHVADLLALMAGHPTVAGMPTPQLEPGPLRHLSLKRLEPEHLAAQIQEQFLAVAQALLE